MPRSGGPAHRRRNHERKALTLGWRWARAVVRPLLAQWIHDDARPGAPLTGTLTFLLQQAVPLPRHAEGFSFYSACWWAAHVTGPGHPGRDPP